MKTKTSTLKKKLWKIFAVYIKIRDKWTCVTCGKYDTGYGMGAGHYIAKAACGAEYYFHEKNVHAQCTDCNLRKEGNRPEYRKFILRSICGSDKPLYSPCGEDAKDTLTPLLCRI
jgi:hypothetical protein